MDQTPYDFYISIPLLELSELISLLGHDVEKWGWLIDELESQLALQLATG